MSLGRILSMGARSPAGLDARQLLLTARAQRATPRRLDLPHAATDGELVPGSIYGTVRAYYLPDDLFGAERLLDLAAPALIECLRTSPELLPSPIPLILAGPERRPDDGLPPPRAFLADLADKAGIKLDLARSDIIVGGHAGFAVALEQALALSSSAGTPVLVGGLDTYHCRLALEALDAEKRLHGPSCHDGIIPAEGAAFFAIDAREPARSTKLASIAAVASGAEETTVDDEEPRIASVLTDVVRRVTSSTLGGPVPWVMVDLNGERHRAKDWSFVVIRLRDRLGTDETFVEMPCGALGDLGAASGAVYAAMACSAWSLGLGQAPRVLVALSADGAPRGAFTLEAP